VEDVCESFFPPNLPLLKTPIFPIERFFNEAFGLRAISPRSKIEASKARSERTHWRRKIIV
jgi:hypothetical protein